jgi:hypothetical protein
VQPKLEESAFEVFSKKISIWKDLCIVSRYSSCCQYLVKESMATVDEAGANSSLFSEQIVESAISFQQEVLDTNSSCHSGTVPVAWKARYGVILGIEEVFNFHDRIKIRR